MVRAKLDLPNFDFDFSNESIRSMEVLNDDVMILSSYLSALFGERHHIIK
jgi:hypothetical protein